MTAIERGFLAERMQETISELEAVREKLRSTSLRLGEAENALKYYGDPRNYGLTVGTEARTIQNSLTGDFQTADNSTTTMVAGKRSREYFKKYENG